MKNAGLRNMQNSGEIIANLVDIENKKIFLAKTYWINGSISQIKPLGKEDNGQPYLIPGFIDAHVHIESSMMLPSEFARLAVTHGSIASVSDPHEIANVLGLKGVQYMLANAAKTPFKIYFGAPSCVPATPFETAGESITLDDIKQLFENEPVQYLSEMMNFPGVLGADAEVMEKINLAKSYGYPIDGHAPGLSGSDAELYSKAGISTDHECTSIEEARDKIASGMKILIREGSAARDFEILHPLISEFPEHVMFCSDDKHPDELARGHINHLVEKAVSLGHSVFNVLRCACSNPIQHYHLNLGLLKTGQPMNAVLVNDLNTFKVESTWLDGILAAEKSKSLLPSIAEKPINNFHAGAISAKDLEIQAMGDQIRVIDTYEGKLFTREKIMAAKISNRIAVPDPTADLSQLCVLNRYAQAKPANAFITGTGLKRGAIASTVAHDSHNIIAMGADTLSIGKAINSLIAAKGGICVVDQDKIDILPLPIAGLMSLEPGETIATRYAHLDKQAKKLGINLSAPFMTLSFMALLVIPELKLSDRGLFDGRTFEFTSIFV